MNIDYYIFTNQGDRNYNEDYSLVRICGENSCFIVNDGLGGCGKGEIASALVAKSIESHIMDGIEDNFLKSSFCLAEHQLEEKQKENISLNSMKTTSVVLSINNNYAQWAHIGDSRLYYFRQNRIKERTLDHSVPQMLVNMKEIKEKDIRFHKDRNRLLKAIGNGDPNLEPTISRKYKLSSKTAFLLCTDGFWELIDEKEMIGCLRRTSNAKDWVKEMGAIVVSRGKGNNMDNVTAIGVRIK